MLSKKSRPSLIRLRRQRTAPELADPALNRLAQRAIATPALARDNLTPQSVLRLQQTTGNRAVNSLLAAAQPPAPLQTKAQPEPRIQRYLEWEAAQQNWVENNQAPVGKYFFNNQFLDNPPTVAARIAHEQAMAQYQVWRQTEPVIIPFRDCGFRVQDPNNTRRGGQPNNPNASKVSELNWTATEDTVDGTIEDFYNRKGDNEKLWLSGADGLQYVGINVSSRQRSMSSQDDLAGNASLVTLILPSAFTQNQLRKVFPSNECIAKAHLTVTLYGLSGQLTPDGRFWMPFRVFKHFATTKGQLNFIGLDGAVYAIDFSQT